MIREDLVYGLKGDAVYDVKDLKKKLKISKKTIRRYIKSGRLKARMIGRSYFVTESGLKAFLEDSDT